MEPASGQRHPHGTAAVAAPRDMSDSKRDRVAPDKAGAAPRLPAHQLGGSPAEGNHERAVWKWIGTTTPPAFGRSNWKSGTRKRSPTWTSGIGESASAKPRSIAPSGIGQRADQCPPHHGQGGRARHAASRDGWHRPHDAADDDTARDRACGLFLSGTGPAVAVRRDSARRCAEAPLRPERPAIARPDPRSVSRSRGVARYRPTPRPRSAQSDHRKSVI